MALFWVDFSASVIVEANDSSEAYEKFFSESLYDKGKNDFVEISNIEEIAEPPENNT